MDSITLSKLPHQTKFHVKKCNAGAMCGKDLLGSRDKVKDRKWITANAEKICKHCMRYIGDERNGLHKARTG